MVAHTGSWGLDGWGRWIAVSSRLAWATEWATVSNEQTSKQLSCYVDGLALTMQGCLESDCFGVVIQMLLTLQVVDLTSQIPVCSPWGEHLFSSLKYSASSPLDWRSSVQSMSHLIFLLRAISYSFDVHSKAKAQCDSHKIPK